MDTRTIKHLVLEEAGLAQVFEKYGIDYCCGGNITLGSACESKGLDLSIVAREIELVQMGRPYSYLHCELWDMEFLVDFIVKNHHRYISETVPVLTTQLAKVLHKHGERYPAFKQVAMLFRTAARELEQHTRKEEMILFPYIKSLASAKELGRMKPIAPFATVLAPIAKMEEEHNQVGDAFRKIRALLHDYTPREGACATEKAMVKGLEEFEHDLHQHIHLENNLLFPMAARYEEDLELPSRASTAVTAADSCSVGNVCKMH